MYINLSQIFKFRNWETEHYNSGLEIRVSLLGMHKWKPDICIGFSTAPHFQFAFAIGNWDGNRAQPRKQEERNGKEVRGRLGEQRLGTCKG
jgi:hypothetical protein